ncbi:helix-turn-helix domain-containing protein [Eubacterium ramulus]
MIHAYDKTYLSNAQKNLARMLDYLTNSLHVSLENAWQWFLTSKISMRFECGDCSVLSGMSGVELAFAVLQEADEPLPVSTPKYPFDRTPEYWTGWALAYYQWNTGLRFSEIEHAIPIRTIWMMYDPYHEMDIRQLVDKLNEMYRTAKPETNLKTLRTLANLSQSELAAQTGISVRTLQQYEQRQKNINHAQTETLLRLSKVLDCTIEDLIEKIDT